MNEALLIQTAEELLRPRAGQIDKPTARRLDAVVEVTALLTAVQTLLTLPQSYLGAITGLDLGVTAGEIEVLYHVCAGAVVVTLRVRLPRETAVVPSICSLIPSASFFERELAEMLGVTVSDTPDTSRLFLPDEWPTGVYPLRKDFQGLG